ncbi:MAG: hypothetical protein PVJ07_08815, partial [Anaerolineales bacterium]
RMRSSRYLATPSARLRECIVWLLVRDLSSVPKTECYSVGVSARTQRILSHPRPGAKMVHDGTDPGNFL